MFYELKEFVTLSVSVWYRWGPEERNPEPELRWSSSRFLFRGKSLPERLIVGKHPSRKRRQAQQSDCSDFRLQQGGTFTLKVLFLICEAKSCFIKIRNFTLNAAINHSSDFYLWPELLTFYFFIFLLRYNNNLSRNRSFLLPADILSPQTRYLLLIPLFL